MKISSCFACWQEIWFSSALKIDESSSRFEKDTVIVSVSFMLCVQHKSKIQKLSTVQLLWCINHSICLVQLSWVLFNSKSNWITDADDKLVEGGTLPLSYDSSILSLGGDIKILNNTICHKKTGPGEFKSKPVQGSSNLWSFRLCMSLLQALVFVCSVILKENKVYLNLKQSRSKTPWTISPYHYCLYYILHNNTVYISNFRKHLILFSFSQISTLPLLSAHNKSKWL